MFLLLAMAVSCTGAQQDGGAAPGAPPLFGLKIEGDDFTHPDRIEPYFQAAGDLGAGYVKVLVPQDLVEPAAGQWTWKVTLGPGLGVDYDQIAGFAQQYHVSVIPMFESPRDGAKQADPEGLFADLTVAFIGRYRDAMDIRFTEFQNEPNSMNDGSGPLDELAIWKLTAKALAEVDNAAYDGIKSLYPDVQVGSPGFISGSQKFAAAYTSLFLDAYFAAGPRFDFFALHDYPKNYSYAQGTRAGDLVSEYHVFDTYRSLLDQSGHKGTPILVTEGFVDAPFSGDPPDWSWATADEAATLWAEGYLRPLAAAQADGVLGRVISGARTPETMAMGLIDSSSGAKRSQYYSVRYLLSLLRRYPSHVATQAALNSDACWVAAFRDGSGKRLWVLLNPLLYETTDPVANEQLVPALVSKTRRSPQDVALVVGGAGGVRISRVDGDVVSSATQAVAGGTVTVTVTDRPVFVEEL